MQLPYFRAPMRVVAALLLLVLMPACRPEVYTPRPRGYARIDTPEHAYQRFDQAGFPYSFEYPTYGHISQDSVMAGMKPDNPYWINIDFPSLGGVIYLSYKQIDPAHPLDKLLYDAHEMSYFHTKRADFINAPAFHTEHGVHGVLYNVGGNAASSYQFFATDSTANFLRGSLYFNTTPNADSLKPVTDFLRTDIEHLLRSLQWK
jgi:gliding motility-associated lipoprotein GldD